MAAPLATPGLASLATRQTYDDMGWSRRESTSGFSTALFHSKTAVRKREKARVEAVPWATKRGDTEVADTHLVLRARPVIGIEAESSVSFGGEERSGDEARRRRKEEKVGLVPWAKRGKEKVGLVPWAKREEEEIEVVPRAMREDESIG